MKKRVTTKKYKIREKRLCEQSEATALNDRITSGRNQITARTGVTESGARQGISKVRKSLRTKNNKRNVSLRFLVSPTYAEKAFMRTKRSGYVKRPHNEWSEFTLPLRFLQDSVVYLYHICGKGRSNRRIVEWGLRLLSETGSRILRE